MRLKMPYKDKLLKKKNRKEHYWKNRKKYIDSATEWVSKNREKHNIYVMKWKNKNRKLINKRKVERWKHEPSFRLRAILSHRVWWVLKKSDVKSRPGTDWLVGCSFEFLKGYIEAQFEKEMNWSNVEIDHIRPCASFDLAKKSQQRECFNYKNLRPISKIENIKKGSLWNGKRHFFKKEA